MNGKQKPKEKAEILPEVWTCDGWPPMLVCGRNWMRGKELIGGRKWSRKEGEGIPEKITFEGITHPVAIQLTQPPVICFYFTGGDESTHEVWTRHKPEQKGLHSQAARLALEEAGRCVDPGLNVWTRKLTCNFSTNKLDERKSAIRRNILIWLAWASWKARKCTFEEARQEIVACGFTLTPKAFQRVLEDAGMTI